MSKIAIFLITFFIIPLSSYATGASKANPQEVEQYVDKLVNEATTLLHNPNLSSAQKASKAKELLKRNLDLEWMAKYTLGKHKKGLSQAQLKKFIQLYSTYVINTYSSMVEEYKGQKTIIKKVQPLNDQEFIVKTEVANSGEQPPINVNYMVRKVSNSSNKSSLKIFDIIPEGISTINTHQQQYGSIIGNNGFDALLKEIQEKS